MANSTTNLDTLSSSQSGKETTANAALDALSPASAFGRRASTSSGLTWGYYGATVNVDGVPTQIANGTLINLPPSKSADSLYIEAGRVSATTKAITAITKAANAQITATGHGYSVGDILFISTAVAGMVEIKGSFCRVVSVVDANNITVDIASTTFTTYTSGGTLAKVGRSSGTVTVGKAHAWHAGLERLYRLTTSTTTVSSYTDYRTGKTIEFGLSAVSMGSDANLTPTADQTNAPILQITSSVSLTATRDIILSDGPQTWAVYNNTTGGQALRFKTAAGSGITVQNKGRAVLYSDGTNVVSALPPQTQTIAYAATITPDAAAGERVVVGTLTGNLTINAPTNPTIGAELHFAFTQDATGGRTVTWDAVFKKNADGAALLNQKSAIGFIYDGTNWVAFSQLALTWL